MSGPIRWLLEPPARVLVDGVRGVRRHRLVASFVGLLLILGAGGGYLLLGALQIDPVQRQYQVRVELRDSGGLLAGQDVTLRGVRVGHVASVEVAGQRVVATAVIDEGTKIPAAGQVRVGALSAAGEQFLDFTPGTEQGPYLTDGALVTADRTSVPVSMATALGDLSGTLAQIDPGKLQAITKELGVGPEGPAKLSAIVDGGLFLISTLDSVLPQTVSLLHNSATVLTTLGQSSAGLRDTSADLAATLGGVSAMTGGYRDLVERTPETLALMNTIIDQNSPTMVQLLGNLATTAQMTYLHVPALQEFFFPQQRAGSALDAIRAAFHDGAVWALVSVYPRSSCDYDVPRLPGSVPDFPMPYLNSDCTDPDPTLLPRGARNAPRPPGDDTATHGDPLVRADPVPVQPKSIPTPYGGSPSPYIPPR